MRCPCKRRKEKWACKQIQGALLARDGKRSYTAATILRLLECDTQCGKAASSSLKPSEQTAAAKNETADNAKVGETSAAEYTTLEDSTSRSKLSKADKQREREERRLARLAAQEEADAKKAMKARLQLAKKVLAVLLLIIGGLGCGLILFRVAAPGDL